MTRRLLSSLLLSLSLSLYITPGTAQATKETVTIDGAAEAHALPHFWEHMFGSGRAILSLRESYLQDLREVKKVTGMEYIRFHAIFHDEVGVYDEDAQGNPVLNFSYVDQIYDGLLANGVRPFVELSFMPKKLASNKDALHAFWYKQNVSPPKDYSKWDEMITQFAKHLVERYGIDEVSQWYFEVWNEPNIDFWAGEPHQATLGIAQPGKRQPGITRTVRAFFLAHRQTPTLDLGPRGRCCRPLCGLDRYHASLERVPWKGFA